MSKPSNAFDVLKSSRKKRAHSSQGGGKESEHPRKKQEEAHGSSFELCPVCSKSVASALLAFHVNICLEESIKGGHSAHNTSEQRAQDQHESIGAAPSTSTGNNPGELIQPLNEDAQPQAATHARAACEEASEGGLNSLFSAAQKADLGASRFTGSTGKASLGEEQSPAHAEHVTCEDQAAQNSLRDAQHKDAKQHDSTQPAARSQSAVPKKAAPTNNAFAHMMQKQKERAQTWTFYLGRHEDGSLFWHMWRDVKGAQPLPNIVTHCSGVEVGIQAPDQATVQRCRQQVVWSAESQASLADLECRVDISADRAASGKVMLRLCTNIDPGHGGRLGMGSLLGCTGRPWEYTGPVSLLKSALQKNIRRKRGEEAVRVAQRLLQSEPGEFLRRACIISLEDALLHPQLPVLAFLMAAAAKGYTLGQTLGSACLRIIHDLAVVPLQDMTSTEQHFNSSTGRPPGAVTLSEPGASLTRSMLLRAAYGGLQGDVAMMRRFAHKWTARLAGLAGGPPPFSPSRNNSSNKARESPWLSYLDASFASAQPPGLVVAWGSMGRLRPEDIPEAAVDFHISSIIEGLLANPSIKSAATSAAAQIGDEPAGVLKSAMWRYSSSVNLRKPLEACTRHEEDAREQKSKQLWPVWETARHAAEAWAHQYIHARFRHA